MLQGCSSYTVESDVAQRYSRLESDIDLPTFPGRAKEGFFQGKHGLSRTFGVVARFGAPLPNSHFKNFNTLASYADCVP